MTQYSKWLAFLYVITTLVELFGIGFKGYLIVFDDSVNMIPICVPIRDFDYSLILVAYLSMISVILIIIQFFESTDTWYTHNRNNHSCTLMATYATMIPIELIRAAILGWGIYIYTTQFHVECTQDSFNDLSTLFYTGCIFYCAHVVSCVIYGGCYYCSTNGHQRERVNREEPHIIQFSSAMA